jgi:hypothetical protein
MNMSAFGGSDFGGVDLDLTENSVSEGLPVLKAGIYDVMSGDVELVKNKGGQMLKIVLADLAGSGQITQNFNIIHSSSEAQRIGRDQLKTFLTHGGHPDPDHPFKHAKEAMLGLKVRIWVEHDGKYVKNNKEYDSFAVKRIGKVDPDNPAPGPSAVQPTRQSGTSSSPSSSSASSRTAMSDDIPF